MPQNATHQIDHVDQIMPAFNTQGNNPHSPRRQMDTNKSGNPIGHNSSSGGNLSQFCIRAPRRMFLCDVPLFIRQSNAKNDSGGNNLVRLMGTVVEIIHTSPSPSSDTDADAENGSREIKNVSIQSTLSTPSIANAKKSTHPTRIIHFIIDDGTGSIGIFTFTRRRVGGHGNSITGASSGDAIPTLQTNLSPQYTQQNQNLLSTANHPSVGTVTFESILSSPHPPILVGQTVDCIGRLQFDTHDDSDVDIPNDSNTVLSPSHKIWLAASSVSTVNNPQALTLRQLELSSSKRLKENTVDNSGRGRHINNPQNRILVGGELERKLNPLFHCNQGSIVFNMETAFNYIKHSKDDGGITAQELALLVGAVDSSEMLAVNLSVEQLREDCRIYLNQGKWFPM